MSGVTRMSPLASPSHQVNPDHASISPRKPRHQQQSEGDADALAPIAAPMPAPLTSTRRHREDSGAGTPATEEDTPEPR